MIGTEHRGRRSRTIDDDDAARRSRTRTARTWPRNFCTSGADQRATSSAVGVVYCPAPGGRAHAVRPPASRSGERKESGSWFAIVPGVGGGAGAGIALASPCSACASAAAVGKRCSGSFSSSVITARARSGGVVGAQRVHRLRPLADVLHQHRRRARRLEGEPPGEHLVADDAERVEIAAAVDLAVARRLLGRHVGRRADRDAGGGEPRVRALLDRARDAEVGHHRAAVILVEQDVVGLDVAVDHAARMRVGERVRDLGAGSRRVSAIGMRPSSCSRFASVGPSTHAMTKKTSPSRSSTE